MYVIRCSGWTIYNSPENGNYSFTFKQAKMSNANPRNRVTNHILQAE